MVKAKKKAKKKAKARPDLLTEVMDDLVDMGGENAAQILGGGGKAISVSGVISTGCPTIDAALGRGGIPFGRLTILHGKEGSGKTTLALQACAEVQRLGGVVVYIDSEYKLDLTYAEALGIDLDRFIISQPNYLERTLAFMDQIAQRAKASREGGKRVPFLVVLDSMNATITKEMFEGDYEDQQIAGPARVYSQKLPKLLPKVKTEDMALLFISQVREKVGVIFGSKEDISGGRAPKHHASVIMEVKAKKPIMKGEDRVGNEGEVYVRKNQVAPPFHKAEFRLVYGKGIDFEHSLILRAMNLELVVRSGAWYSYKGERIGQGIDKAAKNLVRHTEVRDELAAAVRSIDVG